MAALLLLTAATYAGALGAGFVWDDNTLLVDNPRLDSLANLPWFFRSDLWAEVLPDGSGYYRPLFMSWMALLRAIFGLSAPAHHAAGLLWHLLAVAAVHRLIAGLVSPRAALAGALVFALHPVQSEAVVWVSAQNDTMAAAFGLWALALVLPEAPSRRRLVGAGALAAAAALTKESAVLLPAFLVGLDLALRRRPTVARYGALLGGLGLALALRFSADLGGDLFAHHDHVGFVAARAHLLAGLLGGLLVVPWPLAVGRSVRWLDPEPWRVALGLAVWVGVIAVALRPGPRRPTIWLGLGWFLLALAPAGAALLAIGLLGERYLYLPMAGLSLAVAAVLGERGLRWLAIPALVWVGLISARLPDWASRYSIFEAALRDAPSPYVHNIYAFELAAYGAPQEALEHYRAALLAQPPEERGCEVGANVAHLVRRWDVVVEFDRALSDGPCGALPGFLGTVAYARAATGDWQGAAAAVARLQGPDPRGRAEVVRGALARLEGDVPGYENLAGAWKGAVSFDGAVDDLIRTGGRAPAPVPAPQNAN